jgi:hypothetical protein
MEFPGPDVLGAVAVTFRDVDQKAAFAGMSDGSIQAVAPSRAQVNAKKSSGLLYGKSRPSRVGGVALRLDNEGSRVRTVQKPGLSCEDCRPDVSVARNRAGDDKR